jgi:serine protease Do/serine protease DegQ
MSNSRIGPLGCVVLLLSAAVSAQDRSLEPLPSLAPLIEQVAPAVVNISVRGTRGSPDPRQESLEEFLEPFFGAPPPGREFNNIGSGVIVDAERGYLLTNHHVVESGGVITVTLADNRSFIASVVGSDAESDVAVLEIDGRGLTAISFAAANDLKVGDYVVAIGNPFGYFANSATAGIVSGLGRHFIEGDVFEDFIQTDASINPGNSGGALVNLNGELVGINSAIFSGSGGNVGVGFAIPVEMVVSVMAQLVEFGEVRRGRLGVVIDSVTPSLAEDNRLDVTAGALVTRVEPGSAAESAGIRINDVIVEVEGVSVADANELRNVIAMMPPGTVVDLEIARDGRRRSVDAVLDARPATAANQGAPEGSDELGSVLDGVELAVVPESSGGPGLEVLAIERGSQVARARSDLRPGDLIVAVNRQPVSDTADARAIADGARTVTFEIKRASQDADGAPALRPMLVRIR